MHRYLIIVGCSLFALGGCDQPTTEPIQVDFTVKIETEEEQPRLRVPKDERGTIVGDSEGFFRP